jgi:hypothetical protein
VIEGLTGTGDPLQAAHGADMWLNGGPRFREPHSRVGFAGAPALGKQYAHDD